MALLAQAIRVFETYNHLGLAKTKTRAEINRTKKKWYRQKGTGRARHGARSAPIFVGGGVAHGPKNVERKLKLPFGMRRKALKIILFLKAKEEKLVAVSGLTDIKKTKDAQNLLNKIANSKEKIKRFTIILGREAIASKEAFRNLKNVNIVNFRNLNVYDVFRGGTLVFDKGIFMSERKVKKASPKKGAKK